MEESQSSACLFDQQATHLASNFSNLSRETQVTPLGISALQPQTRWSHSPIFKNRKPRPGPTLRPVDSRQDGQSLFKCWTCNACRHHCSVTFIRPFFFSVCQFLKDPAESWASTFSKKAQSWGTWKDRWEAKTGALLVHTCAYPRGGGVWFRFFSTYLPRA